MFVEQLYEIFRKRYQTYQLSKFKKHGNDIFMSYPFFGKGCHRVTLGNKVTLDRNTRIEVWDRYLNKRYDGKITIGNNVCFNPNCHLGAIKSIVIEDNVLIGAGVLITDHAHGTCDQAELSKPPKLRDLYSKGPVHIGKNVWIGEYAVILPGVTIGEGAVIGAHAVVTKDVPTKSVVGGNPARVIK